MGKAVAIYTMKEKRLPGESPDKQEDYFRLLADTTSAAIFIVEGQKIRYANLSARLITGYSPEELTEMEFWQLAHPTYQTVIKKYGVSNQWGDPNGAGGELFPPRYELKLSNKQGQERWVDITAGRLSSSREPSWIVTAFDITERDLAERELRKAKAELEVRVEQRTVELNASNQQLIAELEERERAAHEREKLIKEIHKEQKRAEKLLLKIESQKDLLETIFTSSPGGLAVITGPQLTIQFANPAYRELTPHPEKDPAGKSFDTVWPPQEGFHLRRLIEQVMESGETVNVNRYDRQFPNGETRSFSLSARPLSWNDQPGVLMLFWETTEVEKARSRAETAALEAERRANELDSVINSLTDAVIIYDSKGKILRTNPAAISAYGFNPAGKDAGELSHRLSARKLDGSKINKEDMPSSQALGGNTIRSEPFIITNAQGQEIIVVVSAAPIFSRGELIGAVAAWHDVTERENLSNENRSQRELLRGILEIEPGGIAVLSGVDLVYQMVNQAYRPLLPNPESDPVGKRYEDIWSAEEQGEATRLMRQVLHTGEALRLDRHERRYPDGSTRIYSYHIQRMFWQGQPAVLTVLWETTAIEEARQAAQKRAERARVLADLSQTFAEAGLDQGVVLSTIVHQLAVTMVDACIIRLVSDDGEWLIPVAFHSNHPGIYSRLAEIYTNLKENVHAGMAGKAFTTGKAIHHPQPDEKGLIAMMGPKYQSFLSQYQVGDMYYLPLKASGRILGVLGMVRFVPGTGYSEDDLNFLQDVCDRAALAIDNARLYAVEAQRAIELEGLHKEVQRLARTDILTNAFNRRGFFEMGERELERFHRFGHPLSAMMLDIDGFKALNDTYGHAFGDLVLQSLASVCQKTIRQIDIIGRYGGDEFAILLPESNLEHAGKLADRLHRVLNETVVESPNGPIHLAISIGVAEAYPDTRDLSVLLARADAALYAAKQNGRNQVKRA